MSPNIISQLIGELINSHITFQHFYESPKDGQIQADVSDRNAEALCIELID